MARDLSKHSVPLIAVLALALVISACSAPTRPTTSASTAQQTQIPIAPSQPTAVRPAATATGQPRPASTVPTATPTAVPAVPPQSVWVANTDGQGVYVRRTPSMSDKLRAYPDATELQVTGALFEQDGQRWQPVRAPDGIEGFVPAQYVVAEQSAPPVAARAAVVATATRTAAPTPRTATSAPTTTSVVATSNTSGATAAAPSTLPPSAYSCNPPGLGCGQVSSTTGRVRDQYVSGYTRRDGTYVRPYYRSSRGR